MAQNSGRKQHVLITAGFFLFSVIVVGLLGISLTREDPKKIPSVLLNKPALAFNAQWIQGQQHLPDPRDVAFSLEDFKGRPLILNFWASWCVSCRQEAHYLEQFWKKKGHEVAVVGIAIQDTGDEARKFAKAYKKTYILGLDVDGSAAINYGVTGVPETFFIDSHGIIKHKETGPVNVELIERHLSKILTTTAAKEQG